MPDGLSVEEFAAAVKRKYPDYAEVDDYDLTHRYLNKHPVYKESVNFGPRERTYAAAARAGLSRDLADDFLNVTGGIESGNRHRNSIGVVLESPPDPKTGERAVGFSQIKPSTIKPYGLDPYDEDQNIEGGLRYFSEGGDDPVARRIRYFGGLGPYQRYLKTGRIPKGNDWRAPGVPGTTFEQYVKRTMPKTSPTGETLPDSSPSSEGAKQATYGVNPLKPNEVPPPELDTSARRPRSIEDDPTKEPVGYMAEIRDRSPAFEAAFYDFVHMNTPASSKAKTVGQAATDQGMAWSFLKIADFAQKNKDADAQTVNKGLSQIGVEFLQNPGTTGSFLPKVLHDAMLAARYTPEEWAVIPEKLRQQIRQYRTQVAVQRGRERQVAQLQQDVDTLGPTVQDWLPDLDWHLRMSPEEFQSLNKAQQRKVVNLVAQRVRDDQLRRQAGQRIAAPSVEEEIALRQSIGLPRRPVTPLQIGKVGTEDLTGRGQGYKPPPTFFDRLPPQRETKPDEDLRGEALRQILAERQERRQGNMTQARSALALADTVRPIEEDVEERLQELKRTEAERSRLLANFTPQEKQNVIDLTNQLTAHGTGVKRGIDIGVQRVTSSFLYKLAGVSDLANKIQKNVAGESWIPDWLRKQALTGELSIEEVRKLPSNKRQDIAEFVTTLAASLPEAVGSVAAYGPVAGFAYLGASEAQGRRQGVGEVVKQGVKGALIGKVFDWSDLIAVSSAPASVTETIKRLAKKSTAIGTGTAAVELASGAEPKEAIKAGLTNALLPVVMAPLHGTKAPSSETIKAEVETKPVTSETKALQRGTLSKIPPKEAVKLEQGSIDVKAEEGGADARTRTPIQPEGRPAGEPYNAGAIGEGVVEGRGEPQSIRQSGKSSEGQVVREEAKALSRIKGLTARLKKVEAEIASKPEPERLQELTYDRNALKRMIARATAEIQVVPKEVRPAAPFEKEPSAATPEAAQKPELGPGAASSPERRIVERDPLAEMMSEERRQEVRDMIAKASPEDAQEMMRLFAASKAEMKAEASPFSPTGDMPSPEGITEPSFVRAARERQAKRQSEKEEGIKYFRSGADPYELIDNIIVRGWELYSEKVKPTFQEWSKKLKGEIKEATDEQLKDVWSQIEDPVLVDEFSKPVTVYHQTTKEAERAIRASGFDLSKARARRSDEGVPDGVFFKPEKGSIFTDLADADSAELAANLRIKNPLKVESRDELMAWAKKTDAEYAQRVAKVDAYDRRHAYENREKTDEYENLIKDATLARERLTQIIRREGYDGVIIERDVGGPQVTKTFIALDPKQVKLLDAEAKQEDEPPSEPPSPTGGNFGPGTMRAGEPLPEVKERKFGKRFTEDERIAQDIRDSIGTAKYYEPISNKVTVNDATRLIGERGLPQAIKDVRDEGNNLPFRVRVALGEETVLRLNESYKRLKEAKSPEADFVLDQATDVSEFLMEYGARLGQGVQAFATWARLTPEGKLLTYKRAVDKATKEQQKKNPEQAQEVKDIIAEVNKQVFEAGEPAPEVLADASKAIRKAASKKATEAKVAPSSKERAKAKPKPEDTSIWQRYKDGIARNLESIAKPKGTGQKPPLQEFSDRLLRNVEGLIAKPERAKTPDDVYAKMREVVENFDKYKEAWDEAVQFIREKYKDKTPAELAEIERRITDLHSAFQTRAFDKVYNDAVKQAEINFKELARSHYDNRTQTKDKLIKDIQERLGIELSPEDAAELAAKVTQRTAAKILTARERILEAMERGKNKTAKKVLSQTEKLIEAARLGVLNEQKFYEIAAEKLGLPKYDKDVAAKILQLAGEVEAAPEGMPRDAKVFELNKFIAQQKGFSPGDLPMGIYYGNILSGYNTHLVNAVDTMFNVISEVNGLAMNNPRAAARVYGGMLRGFIDGRLDALLALTQGRMVTDGKWLEIPKLMEIAKFGEKGGVPIKVDTRTGRAIKAVAESPVAYPLNAYKYVTRLLAASDAVFFRSAKEARASLLAYRMAQAEGLKGELLESRVQQILSLDREADFAAQAKREGFTGTEAKVRTAELRDMARDKGLSTDAAEFAGEATYNHKPHGILGYFAEKVGEASEKVKPLKLFVPFTRIVANVTNRGLNYTPWGYKRAFFGYSFEGPLTPEAKRLMLTRATLGLVGINTLAAMQAGGLIQIHGNGPSDREKRRQMQAAGWRPYTLQIGDVYVSYMNSPLALGLSITGNMTDSQRYHELEQKDAATRGAYAVARLGSTVFSQSFLSGLSRLFNALSEEPSQSVTAVKQILGSTAAAATTPNLARDIYRLFDNKTYQSNTLMEDLIRNTPFAVTGIPGVKEPLKPALNAFGEPVTLQRQRFFDVMSSDPAWRFVTEKGLRVPVPSKTTELADGERISPDEYYNLLLKTGPRLKQWITDNQKLLGEMKEQDAQSEITKASEAITKDELNNIREGKGMVRERVITLPSQLTNPTDKRRSMRPRRSREWQYPSERREERQRRYNVQTR